MAVKSSIKMPSLMISPFQLASVVTHSDTHYNMGQGAEDTIRGAAN